MNTTVQSHKGARDFTPKEAIELCAGLLGFRCQEQDLG